MTKSPTAFVMVTALMAGSTPALAQPDGGRSSSPDYWTHRPVELVIGVDGVASAASNGGDLRISLGLPKGDLSFEIFGGLYRGGLTDTGRDFLGDFYQPRGIYGFQVRQWILRGQTPDIYPFITYGAMGVIGGCGHRSCPAGNAATVVPPLLGLLGTGLQHNMGARAAVRLELQGGFVPIPVGVRLSAAVVIPFGRFPAYPNDH